MPRCVAAGVALLFAAATGGVATPANDVSVKLWLDTTADNPCEQAAPASGGWMIRNNENRNVFVVLHRVMTKGEAKTEDQMRDTLGPRETREMGCEVSDGARQSLSVAKASF